MEMKKEQSEIVKNDLLDKSVEDVKGDRTLDENKSSVVATNLFSKPTGRKNNSFGPGHDPGSTPGAGI